MTETQQIILEIVKTLAWPVAVLLIAWIVKREMGKPS